MDAIDYYNSVKSSYDKLYRVEQENKVKFLIKRINIPDSALILDAGAGSGVLEELIHDYRITALEPSDLADELKSKGLKNVSIEKKTIQGFSTDIKFDFIFCITVLQDIDKKERDGAVKKLFSLAKDGATIIISVLAVSNINLGYLNPVESGYIENDRYFIFVKQ